jgi:GNAT superfamily N-acetyltransferase
MGRLYVAAWRDSYPSLLPAAALLAMSEARSARQFEFGIARGRDIVLVAEKPAGEIAGLLTAGGAVDRGLRVGADRAQGEIVTLYVDPMATGQGVGARLLNAGLVALAERGHGNGVVWVLRGNPARFFYEHMGARLVAAKRERSFGKLIDLEAYAWPDLSRALMRRSA